MTLSITFTNIITRNPYSCHRFSIIGIVTSLGAGWTGCGILFLFSKSPDWLWALLNPLLNKYHSSSLEVKWPRLEDDLSVPRLRMSGSTPLLRYTPSWCGWGQFYVLLYVQVTVHRDKLRINNQLDASYIQIYFVIKLYMFRAPSVPIIRSYLL
jgi:hypothetical protein